MVNRHNIDYKSFINQYEENHWDLALVDPEYGRKQHGGVNRSKWVTQENGSKLFVKNGNHYKKKDWDNEPVNEKGIEDILRVSKHQIIWGCNYLPFYLGPGRIVWNKCNEGSDQSDCEIAYNSLNDRVDMFTYMWRGMMQGKSAVEGHVQQGNKKLNEVRIHPTQKPVILYKWLLKKYAENGWRILDTHGGSFSSAIACYDLGFNLDICEIDDDYFTDGSERFLSHTKQLKMF